MAATSTLIAGLRDRAAALRRVAATIENSEAVVLYRRAGGDTWIGPTPEHCLNDLHAIRRTLLTAADGLRSEARRIDQRAQQLEAESLSPALWGRGS